MSQDEPWTAAPWASARAAIFPFLREREADMLRGRKRWSLPCDEFTETTRLPLRELAQRLDLFAEAVAPVVDELPDGAALASILADLIAGAIEQPDPRSDIALYQILISDWHWRYDTYSKLHSRLREMGLLEDPRTYAYFVRMLLTTPDAAPANFCLYMLHTTAQAPPLEVVRIFAMHDSFVAYASRMIADRYEEAEDVLIELAKVGDGWQRVHILDYLHVVAKPENRAWLLQEGYRNGVCEIYTLHKAAVLGDLIGRLRAGNLALKELLHIGAILWGLTDTCGPRDCQYLYDYEDGPEACRLFIGHCESQARHEGLYFAVRGLVKFMAEDDFDDPPERAALWPADVRREIAQCGREYLDRPDWPQELIHRFSEKVDPSLPSVRWLAGGDLTRFPELMEAAEEPGLILALSAWAESYLQLNAFESRREARRWKLLATPMTDDPDPQLGSVYGQVVLGMLRLLVKAPGVGWEIIRAGLATDIPFHRPAAAEALAKWPDRLLTPEIEAALQAAFEETYDLDAINAIDEMLWRFKP